MKIMKKNQIVVSIIAIMLITVGYMNFTMDLKNNTAETAKLMQEENIAGIGDAKLVNSENVTEEDELDGVCETNNEAEIVENEDENSTEVNTQITSASLLQSSDEYFVASKMEREKIYSQMLESYDSILKNEYVSVDQKNDTAKDITNLNNQKNSIMIAENLIKNIGFSDVVIFINDGSVNVIIKAEKLKEDDVAKIQNIVCREIGVEVEKIHISLK